MKYALSSEHYLIPIPDRQDRYAVYFPHKFLLLEVNRKGKETLESLEKSPYIGNERDLPDMLPDMLRDLYHLGLLAGSESVPAGYQNRESKSTNKGILLISEACNLNCVYCYGSSTPRGEKMPFSIAKAAIDFLIKNALKTGKNFIQLSFNGGGEPTTNWEVLKESVHYAKEECRKKRLKCITVLVTNGYFDVKKMQWISEHITSVTVSLDGPPEIHDTLRPVASDNQGSYRFVEKTLDYFISRGKQFKIRVTCTDLNTRKLPEIVDFIARRFHPVLVQLELLHDCGRCSETHCSAPRTDDFINSFLEASRIAKSYHMPLFYSGGRLEHYGATFCDASGGAFSVTPRGEVTACLEFSKNESEDSDPFHFGRYDQNRQEFLFDDEKIDYLASLNVHNFPSCKNCFAKWNCSGDCIVRTPDPHNVYDRRNSARCRINKTLLSASLTGLLEGGKDNKATSSRGEIVKAVDLVHLNPDKRIRHLPRAEWRERSRYIIDSDFFHNETSMGYFAHRKTLHTVIKPTNQCNAECVYCSTDNERTLPLMSLDVVEEMYEKLFHYAESINLKIISFLWHGGEPSILGKEFYRKAWELSKNRNDIHILHRIQTNLMAIDREWLDLFKTYNVQVGTSVDPLVTESRIYKGKQMLPTFIKNFYLFEKEHYPLGIVVTVIRQHLGREEELFNFMKNLFYSSASPVAFKVNPLYAAGRAANKDFPYQISPREFGLFLVNLWNAVKDDPLVYSLTPFKEWITGAENSCEYYGNCQDHFISIDAEGGVYHCGRFFDYGQKWGNIRQQDMSEILLNSDRFDLFERESVLRSSDCKDCPFWEYCHGGCPYLSLLYFNTIMKPDPFCTSTKYLFETTDILEYIKRYRGRRPTF